MQTALLLTLLAPSVVGAATPPRDTFPPRIEVGGKKLLRNGVGLCEWGFFQVDLYWAALYLEEKSQDPARILGTKKPKELRLHFVRALTRKQLTRAYNAAFKINAGETLGRYEKRLARFTSWLRDVRVGEQMVFTYVPARGLRVQIGRKEAGWIEGEDFAKLFFTLYIGPTPPDKDLKKGLLGRD